MLGWVKIPDYGDHMTMEQFCANCEFGAFINSDGFGNYATATEMLWDGDVYPSMVKAGTIDRNYTHIVWFNK